MSEPIRSIDALDLCANALALDFVNTVQSRVETDPFDYLGRYEDLVRWLDCQGLLVDQERGRLLAEARAHPRKAARLPREARQLREALYRLFLVIIRGGKAAAGDLEIFNRWLSRALTQQRLVPTAEGFSITWSREPPVLDRVLWPVLESAADLLANGPQDRIRECDTAEGGCGWLFLDTSKNGTRRWCDMRTCGNVAKVRRHRKTQRAMKT